MKLTEMIPVGFGILAGREIGAGLVWLENNRENLALFGKRPQVKEKKEHSNEKQEEEKSKCLEERKKSES